MAIPKGSGNSATPRKEPYGEVGASRSLTAAMIWRSVLCLPEHRIDGTALSRTDCPLWSAVADASPSSVVLERRDTVMPSRPDSRGASTGAAMEAVEASIGWSVRATD